MSSGDTIAAFKPEGYQYPDANYATIERRNTRFLLNFAKGGNQAAMWRFFVPRHYANGNFSVVIEWMAQDFAGAGNVVWQIEFEREDVGTDLDADSFGTAVAGAASAANAVNGKPTYTTIALTRAQADTLTAGEWARARITRLSGNAGDTLNGIAQFAGAEVREV